MTKHAKGQALALLFCALAGCSVTSPQIPNGAAQRRMPVIVDTDMGFDDWMAILYLLNEPFIEVKAITRAGPH